MDEQSLKSKCWYWVRRSDGDLAPYRFHRVKQLGKVRCGEFFVGSMLQTFPLSRIVGEAKMPERER